MARNRFRNNRYRSSRGRKLSNSHLIGDSINAVRSTSRRYMPKMEHGLENVGAKVTRNATRTVPFLQRLTRKIFSKFSPNTNARSRSKRRR